MATFSDRQRHNSPPRSRGASHYMCVFPLQPVLDHHNDVTTTQDAPGLYPTQVGYAFQPSWKWFFEETRWGKSQNYICYSRFHAKIGPLYSVQNTPFLPCFV